MFCNWRMARTLLPSLVFISVCFTLFYSLHYTTTGSVFEISSALETAQDIGSTVFYLHYIWLKSKDSDNIFSFINYLSVISGINRLLPDKIILHGDIEPEGPFKVYPTPHYRNLVQKWAVLVHEIPRIRNRSEKFLNESWFNTIEGTVKRNYWNELKSKNLIEFRYREKTDIAGHRFGKAKKVGWVEHSADMVKLDVLVEYGGVVADFDVFFVRGERIKEILKSKESITCYGDEDGYNIGFVAARKGAKLIRAWRLSYDVIYVKDWNFNQSPVARYLSILYSDVNYVVNNVCNNPHPDHLSRYFKRYGEIMWTDSLAIHSYERFGDVTVKSPEDLEGSLTSHKELLRSIYLNSGLPPADPFYRDEMDPLTDELVLP